MFSQDDPDSKINKINMKIKCNIFVYIPGTGLWEFWQAVKPDCQWWMSHLSDALQSLHPVLAEESQENKWLSFTFQEQDRGDRQCECHSLCSIDFSATNVKKSLEKEASRKCREVQLLTNKTHRNPLLFLFLKKYHYPL